MCTVKLSFTCLNISSEVNIPKTVVCWLRVNAKARGGEKGKVKWEVSVPKHFSSHSNWSSVSDPQVRRTSAIPWLSSHFLVTFQNWSVYTNKASDAIIILIQSVKDILSWYFFSLLFSWVIYCHFGLRKQHEKKLSKQNSCKNIICKITPSFCSIWL